MGFLDRFKKKNDQLESLGKDKKQAVLEIKEEMKKEKGNTEPKKAKAKKTEEKEKTVKSKTEKKGKGGHVHNILVAPLVSEKAATEEALGKYTFVVETTATKTQIRQAVQDIYSVVPEKIRVINMEGKKVRFGRYTGRRKDWKKAVVSLPKGKSINIHEGV